MEYVRVYCTEILRFQHYISAKHSLPVVVRNTANMVVIMAIRVAFLIVVGVRYVGDERYPEKMSHDVGSSHRVWDLYTLLILG